MQKILAIAGPTASGKSNIAVQIAKKINGEIISMDSMQIYKGMDIGTAKVTINEMDGIPHYMINIAEPNMPYSVSDFVSKAKEIINQIVNKGKLPILAGGTGLYYESLIYPFNFGGAKSDEKIKNRLYEELDKYGAEYMHKKLMQIDPIDGAKIHQNNTKRLIRALEIYEITGDTKSNTTKSNKNLQYDIDMFVLDIDREILYDRIEKRVQIMFESGLVDEIKTLLLQGINFDMQSMQGIGYKEFKDYFAGKMTLEVVKNLIILNSRHYAKRQITWFKHYDFAKFITPQELLNHFNIDNE